MWSFPSYWLYAIGSKPFFCSELQVQQEIRKLKRKRWIMNLLSLPFLSGQAGCHSMWCYLSSAKVQLHHGAVMAVKKRSVLSFLRLCHVPSCSVTVLGLTSCFWMPSQDVHSCKVWPSAVRAQNIPKIIKNGRISIFPEAVRVLRSSYSYNYYYISIISHLLVCKP